MAACAKVCSRYKAPPVLHNSGLSQSWNCCAALSNSQSSPSGARLSFNFDSNEHEGTNLIACFLLISGLYLFLQVKAPLSVGVVRLRHYLLIGWGENHSYAHSCVNFTLICTQGYPFWSSCCGCS